MDATELQQTAMIFRSSILACFLVLLSAPGLAQESPYIVTYDHYLEEPGNLEIEYFSTYGTQPGGNNFDANWIEFEYGVKAWWTTEFYLDAQTTFGDSMLRRVTWQQCRWRQEGTQPACR